MPRRIIREACCRDEGRLFKKIAWACLLPSLFIYLIKFWNLGLEYFFTEFLIFQIFYSNAPLKSDFIGGINSKDSIFNCRLKCEVRLAMEWKIDRDRVQLERFVEIVGDPMSR